jgi:hypothetical protein
MQLIAEMSYDHISSASYRPTHVAGSPISYESHSSGHRSSSTFPSPMSSLSEQSHFSFHQGSPMRPTPNRSNLTHQLATQSQLVSNDYTAAQPGSPMATSPIFTGSPNPAASPEDFLQFSPRYSHFQPPPHGYNFNQDQEISRQLDTQLIAMQQDVSSPALDMFSSATGSVPSHPMGIPIQRTARHSSSGGSFSKPYSRGESMTFSPKSEFSSSLVGSLPGGSYTATPTMGAGFSHDQIPAAQAILQFIAERPTEPIPSHLINDKLVEISGGRGYCLIGNCGIERAMQKGKAETEASKDPARKRADHLYDHIRDKHFDCRPFRCNLWYVLNFPFGSFLAN